MSRDRHITGDTAFAASQDSKEKEYWLRKLSGGPERSRFFYDNPDKPGISEREYSSPVPVEFSPGTLSALEAISKNLDHRLYMILTAGLTALLYRYTGDTDITVGSPIFKQESGEDGDFINTVLPLRNVFDEGVTFKELLLNHVRPTILEAIEHQNYPMDSLAFQLNLPGSPDRSPFFDVAILLENLHDIEYIRYAQPGVIFSFSTSDEGVIRGDILYDGSCYHQRTIDGIAGHYGLLLARMLEDMDCPVSRIDMKGDEEKQQLLVAFNDTRQEYPRNKTIDELFRDRVNAGPDGVALIVEGEQFTFSQLNEDVNRLAGYLYGLGLRRGEPVGVMVTATDAHWAVPGILAILTAGGAYVPLNCDYPLERKTFILRDCHINILLTDSDVSGLPVSNVLQLDDPAIYSDDIEPVMTIHGNHGSDDLAYILYTSGSSGVPKGVMVEHRSVVRLVKNTDYIRFGADDRILSTGALEFDASTFELWGALLNGLPLLMIGKETILNHDRFKRAILRGGVSIMWMTGPFFNRVLDTDTDADMQLFSGLRHLIVGGDVLSPSHINRLREGFPGLLVTNGYGPTENTTFSTTHLITREYPGRIPIGKPIANSTIYILDNGRRPVPVGVPGEIFVGGDGLSRGYLNNPELTSENFKNKLYKTGDLGRWLLDGVIEFLGRRDEQVKIRGYRIEPGEIENNLLRIEGVNEAVVIARETREGEKVLCAYVVLAGSVEPGTLKDALSDCLPDYMVPAHVTALETLPLTPNGKVDRRALPEPEISGGAAYVAPGNEVQEGLVEIWSEVLGVDAGEIGIDADYFQLGGHSLNAAAMLAKLHKAFDVKVPFAELFRTPTIRELSFYIHGAGQLEKETYAAIPVAAEKPYYALSPAQKRLYIVHQMEFGSTGYNISYSLLLEGDPDIKKLEWTFQQLIRRHESLRTSFEMVDERPVQVIHADPSFKMEYYRNLESGKENFVRPFDLTRAPLLRVRLVLAGEAGYILMIDMHHIITDGISMELFAREVVALYAGVELLPLKLQYKDYSEWQNSETHRNETAKQERFWLDQLAEEIPVLQLPTDYPRPSKWQFDGDALSFRLSPEQARGIREIASGGGVTLYMVVLAIFTVLLSKVGNQEDIVVGTPIAARRHTDLERIIGMFVNTLAMRNYPRGHKTFAGYLEEVRERTLESFENQEYQFEDLVDKVETHRDVSRNPIFDVTMAVANIEAQAQHIPAPGLTGFRARPYEEIRPPAKFDLQVTFPETLETSDCYLIYSTRLFNRRTIERLRDYFLSILWQVSQDRHALLSGISIISEAEKTRILKSFNNSAGEGEYPVSQPLHRLFEEQVQRTPGRAAVSAPGTRHGQTSKRRSFWQLDKESGHLANRLRANGVTGGSIVALMTDRSPDMVIGILGILKAGAAYLPIEPHFPRRRIAFMLADSKATVLLSTRILTGEVKDLQRIGLKEEPVILFIDSKEASTSSTSSTSSTPPDSLAYVLYTSGSTGRPKGVMIEQRSVVNLVYGLEERIFRPYGAPLNIALLSPYVFDVSVQQLFSSLLLGHCLHIVPEESRTDGVRILEFLDTFRVDVCDGTPAHLRLLTAAMDSLSESPVTVPYRLKLLLIGGEALTGPVVSEFYLCFNRPSALIEETTGPPAPPATIINIYGPTECTVDSTMYEIPGETGEPPETRDFPLSFSIGAPMPNVTVIVLSRYLRLQPIGVAGQLCISGASVGRGYLNRPGLTGEKFGVKTHFSLYQTGDLGRWLSDGNLEFLGRMDHQVKVRGFRVELGEIEARLLSYEEVSEAVVMVTPGENLCAYVVPVTGGNGVDVSKLRRFLGRYLPDYMVPGTFISIPRIPLTPNGKIDRKALLTTGTGTGDAVVPPRDEVEAKLVELWGEVLSLDASTAIGIDDNFFQLGGHSLKATVLGAKIHKVFHVKLALGDVFKTPRIRELAGLIKQMTREKYMAVEPVEKQDYYPLSSAQKRLYVLHQMDLNSTAYNMPQALPLSVDADTVLLESVFLQLVRRHESLRTSFLMIGREPVQRVCEPGQVEFQLQYVPGVREFVRPFELSNAPLLRVGLLENEEDGRLLLIDMHHIISDGVSHTILAREFSALYRGNELPPLRLQYKDFSHWQNSRAESGYFLPQETWWLKQFETEIPVIDLPLDFPRPVTRDFDGETQTFELSGEFKYVLDRLAVKSGATLYIVLLTLYSILLSRISGQEDIVVGTPIAGRRHADLEKIIGMFVNTLAIRNYPKGNKSVEEYLMEVKERCLEAFENQEYQFEDLVDRAEVQRDAGRNPLFDVMLSVPNIKNPETEPGEDQSQTSPATVKTIAGNIYNNSKFDLAMGCRETTETLTCGFTYSTVLFKPATIQRLMVYFKRILAAVREDSHQTISGIDIMPPEEKHRVLYAFNDTDTDYPADKTFHGLFEEQAERHPYGLAVVGHNNISITYSELNRRADGVAFLLNEKGVKPNSIAGIMVEPSVEMMVGILGILKAGGAYLPIDSNYPEERVDFMLQDSGAEVLIGGVTPTFDPPPPPQAGVCRTWWDVRI